MLRSATWTYFLLSRLHASSIALVQEAQAFLLSRSLVEETVGRQFSPQAASCWDPAGVFPKRPLC